MTSTTTEEAAAEIEGILKKHIGVRVKSSSVEIFGVGFAAQAICGTLLADREALQSNYDRAIAEAVAVVRTLADAADTAAYLENTGVMDDAISDARAFLAAIRKGNDQ